MKTRLSRDRKAINKPMTRTLRNINQDTASHSTTSYIIVWILATGILEAIIVSIGIYLSIINPSWTSDYHILVTSQIAFYATPFVVILLEFIL